MFWNKKEEKDSLPDLPPIKTPMRPAFDVPRTLAPVKEDLDENDDDSVEKHGLPSFPDSPIQRGFSQSAIKDAIGQDAITPEQGHDEIPVPANSPIRTVELDIPPMSQPKPFTLDEPPERTYVPPRKPTQRSGQNEIFVKIDRFNTAYKSLTTISKKVDEIDHALRKIREVKMREEQELVAWEKELSSLKARLQEINDNLFE